MKKINAFWKSSDFNLNSMIINGSVAVLSILGSVFLFGFENVMLAFPIALTSIVLSRQNIYVKTFSKFFRIVLLDLFIIFMAYLSSSNFYLGILINFLCIFLICYTLISPYDMTFYKPFIMLYVFAQYSSISINSIPNRFLTVIFGVFVIVILRRFLNKDKESKIFLKSINEVLSLINSQIDNILNNNFSDENLNKCTKLMRSLAYRIYILRHKKYLITYMGRIEFNLYIVLEHLNISLKDLYFLREKNLISKEEILSIKNTIEIILDFINNKASSEDVEISMENLRLIKSSENISNDFYKSLKSVYKDINNILHLNKKYRNKIYKKWLRSDIDRFKSSFKEYFKPNSIRFKFAMRMSITLTISLFIGEFLGYDKVIWAIITIMSIMQPYYEDTIVRTKDRLKGNIVAILFLTITIGIIDNKLFTVFIFIISVYFIYAFKSYYKLSLFASIASICVASLSYSIGTIVVLRLLYVIIGAIIVILANKYIFPYKIKDGVTQIMLKIMRLNNLLVKDVISYIKGDNTSYKIRDNIIHLSLLSQKLYFRNLQYEDKKVEKFLQISSKMFIEVGYKILKEY